MFEQAPHYPRGPRLIWHHAMPFEHVRHGIVEPVQLSEIVEAPEQCAIKCGWQEFQDWHDAKWMEACYSWLKERCGFYPLFLAVGDDQRAVGMTGYMGQFERIISYSKATGSVLRPAGEFPSSVMFSFDAPPKGVVYSDYDYWHIVMNSTKRSLDSQGRCHYEIEGVTPYEERLVIKPSWDEKRWLQYALRSSERGQVQGVVPSLDLRQAKRVWCRSEQARKQLVALGFERGLVQVCRTVGDRYERKELRVRP